MKMTPEMIVSLLPYSKPFLFVDNLDHVDTNGAIGTYTYPHDSFFYKGHFVNNPVTPGVILTETMAQIGLVCLGLFLMAEKLGVDAKMPEMFMVENNVAYFLPVFPGETVTVVSKKEYFRFGKLKCQVELSNNKNELVCKGMIAGMINRHSLISDR